MSSPYFDLPEEIKSEIHYLAFAVYCQIWIVLNWITRVFLQPTSIAPQRLSHMLWWRHQMETFSALLAICAGNSPVTGEFPAQRPVTRSFEFFFDLCLNNGLGKQWWGWWFETPSRPLWHHCNVTIDSLSTVQSMVQRRHSISIRRLSDDAITLCFDIHVT